MRVFFCETTYVCVSCTLVCWCNPWFPLHHILQLVHSGSQNLVCPPDEIYGLSQPLLRGG
jgi:hypothetical protein